MAKLKVNEPAKQIERVRRICLSFPETTEKISHGEPTWFVRKKVFAMFSNNHHNDGHIAVTVPAAIGIQEALVEASPSKFYRPPYVGVRGWIGIEVAAVSDQELRQHISEGWKLIAPPKLQASIADDTANEVAEFVIPASSTKRSRASDCRTKVQHRYEEQKIMNRPDQFIPHLIVSDGLAALRFYREVFGGEEGHNMMAPDGKRLMHGELVLDGHRLFISDQFGENEGGTCKSPATLGGTCVRITLEVADADAVAARAVAAGAQVLMPIQDMFWGARYGKLKDPFGHEWGINQQLEERTPEQTESAADEFFKGGKS